MWSSSSALDALPTRSSPDTIRPFAPLAQLDRALPSEGRGQTFESSGAHHANTLLHTECVLLCSLYEYSQLPHTSHHRPHSFLYFLSPLDRRGRARHACGIFQSSLSYARINAWPGIPNIRARWKILSALVRHARKDGSDPRRRWNNGARPLYSDRCRRDSSSIFRDSSSLNGRKEKASREIEAGGHGYGNGKCFPMYGPNTRVIVMKIAISRMMSAG